MQKSAYYKTRVGLFVVVGTVLLVAALYFIGNKQHIFSKNIQLYAVFQNVNGLQLGNNVRYSGINIGTVGKIEMVDRATIVVQMMVEKKTGAFIKRDAIATIGSDGLVGSMVINILPGKSNLTTIISGDTIATYSRIGAEDILSTLNVTNENAALLTADLLKVTNEILKGKGTLGALIKDSTLIKDIRSTLTNLKNTSKGTNQFVTSINQKISKIDMEKSTVGLLLNDTILGLQIQNSVSNIEQSSIAITETAKQFETMVAKINSANSTFNYLTKDEELPKAIDSTMIEITETSRKLNEIVEALKHSFLFRKYFRKQDREIEKKSQTLIN